MKIKYESIVLVFISSIIVLTSCYPSKKVSFIANENLPRVTDISSPSKVFLKDASFLIFQNGFRVIDNTIEGQGQRIFINIKGSRFGHYSIPMDSVVAISYYELKSSSGSILGSVLLGLYGGFITPYSIRCITCPKCCFGSCPTVYTDGGDGYNIEAELFSYSISKFFQKTDLDRLSKKISNDGLYQIRISNEALETHYINQFALIEVTHPIGTEVFPSDEGEYIVTRDLQAPITAINSIGEDVLYKIQSRDNVWYRSDTNMVKRIADYVLTDWVDLKFDLPKKATKVKIVMHLRNTLLSTILFYDVVLASQGIRAIEWIERINTDSVYAAQFNDVYEWYGGMDLSVLRDGKWVDQISVSDVGPIAGKDIAIELQAERDENGFMEIRFEFFPDNFMIDYIAVEVSEDTEENVSIKKLMPEEIYDVEHHERSDILRLVENSDKEYLVTNPGESYYFHYYVTVDEGFDKTYFIKSKGYYTEWLRGDWLSTESLEYSFDLFNVDQTITRLRESWLANRELMENEFFKSRIPLKED